MPKAKFPAIDIHGHAAGALTRRKAWQRSIDGAGQAQRRALRRAPTTCPAQRLQTARSRWSTRVRYKDRVRILTGVNLNNVGPGWAEKAVAQLEADIKAGAVGVGEIGKGFGLTHAKADGTRLASTTRTSTRSGRPRRG